MAARFTRRARLLKPAEFDRVFTSGSRCSNPCFNVVTAANSLEHPRLGLALSKKALPRAVDRNRVKRQIRESFRLHQATLPAQDIIFMARPACVKTAHAELREGLSRLWRKLPR